MDEPVISLLGVTVHEADVALTDVALAVVAVTLAWWLWRGPDRGAAQAEGATLLAGLSGGALWGAIYHGLLPAGTTTTAGLSVWTLVGLSLAVVGATLLDLGLRIVWPGLTAPVRRRIVSAYAILAVLVFLIDNSSSTMVRFHAPAGVFFLFGAAREAVRSRERSWTLVTVGILVSAAGALMQQMRIAIDPAYFDHNALYHVVQAGAVVLLYLGFAGARLDQPGRIP